MSYLSMQPVTYTLLMKNAGQKFLYFKDLCGALFCCRIAKKG